MTARCCLLLFFCSCPVPSRTSNIELSSIVLEHRTRQQNMPAAADIITYIGVPLAVLGVMPILFTCLKAVRIMLETLSVRSHG